MRLILFSIIFLISTFIGCGGDNHGTDNVDTPVKSLAEITADLAKVNIDSWDAVVDERDILGKIAVDLKRSLPKPLGELASRTILLQKRLIIFIKQDMDIKNKENYINKILADAKQLKSEINESILVTSENESVNLKRLNGLSKSTEESQDQTKRINKYKIGYTVNRDEDEEDEPLIDRRKENARRNKERELKSDVESGPRLLMERLEE